MSRTSPTEWAGLPETGSRRLLPRLRPRVPAGRFFIRLRCGCYAAAAAAPAGAIGGNGTRAIVDFSRGCITIIDISCITRITRITIHGQ